MEKTLNISVHGHQKSCYVFVVPPFPFPSSSSLDLQSPERLSKIEYFLLHTVSLPGAAEPSSHLFASVLWPVVYPNHDHYGKPVQVWCKDLYESHIMNTFCLVSSISSRATISFDKINNEAVCIAIPVIE